jgi:hypothetical protein
MPYPIPHKEASFDHLICARKRRNGISMLSAIAVCG